MSRLLIDSNGLVALESSIRAVRSEHDGLVAQLDVYQRRIKEEEDRIFEETADLGQDEIAERLREELDFARMEVDKLEQKAFRLEQTMIDMENEQDRRRAATETLKEAIDRALGLTP